MTSKSPPDCYGPDGLDLDACEEASCMKRDADTQARLDACALAYRKGCRDGAAGERESCALLCEQEAEECKAMISNNRDVDAWDMAASTARVLARRIRRRGEAEKED